MTMKFNQRTQTLEDNEKKNYFAHKIPNKETNRRDNQTRSKVQRRTAQKTQKKFQPLVFLPFKSYICQQYRHHL